MNDVAIIGVGLHPFGRHPGKSAIDMGNLAVRAALADAGAEWTDVQFAFGGSYEVDNPDAIVNTLGSHRHHVHRRLQRLRHVRERTLTSREHDPARPARHRHGDRHGQAPPGAFAADPVHYSLPSWYGETGLFLTTKFFAMKIQRYMHDYGITPATLAKAAAKNYRNGSINPHAFRRNPLSEEEILNSRMVNDPLTQYMFCAPDEGAAAIVLCRADIAHRYTANPIYLRASEVRTRRLGAFEVHSPSTPTAFAPAPTVDASKAAYEVAGVGPEDVDVIQLQDTDAGAEIIHMAENGFCKDGDQERLLAEHATDIDGPLPVNTDGGLIANGEPIGASGLRQVYELVHQLRGTAGDRQVPGKPNVGYAQLYGAPGTAGVNIVSL